MTAHSNYLTTTLQQQHHHDHNLTTTLHNGQTLNYRHISPTCVLSQPSCLGSWGSYFQSCPHFHGCDHNFITINNITTFTTLSNTQILSFNLSFNPNIFLNRGLKRANLGLIGVFPTSKRHLQWESLTNGS